jgi:phosphoglycolate phosphatase-like HAD superfamily hydrolase
MTSFSRRGFVSLSLAAISALAQRRVTEFAQDASDPLPSWNDGPAKREILAFVRAATGRSNPGYIPPERRLATFDQDGTLWVEHPIYTQVVFALDRVVALAPQHPQWRTTEPFSVVLSGDKAAIAKLTTKDLETIVLATHTGMDVASFQQIAAEWIAKARNPRWNRPYTDLIYQPMLEVMRLLNANGFSVYIVTGGGQDFVRSYAKRAYGLAPDRIIGSALETTYGYNAQGEGILMRSPHLLLDNNMSGKPEDIYLFTGRRPQAAFGNSTGDRQMLEWTTVGSGARLMMLVLHDDAQREYAYGPATGLPDTKVGTFTQALYDEAKAKGWTVISMRKDWRRIFSFEA